jgi:SAM-dependent methyltransferase
MISEQTMRRWYPQPLDGTWFLSQLLRPRLESARMVLEAGCGSGEGRQLHLRRPGRIVLGLDLDPTVGNNHCVDLRVQGSLDAIPFKDGLFDVVVLRYVVEHLEVPDMVFAELARVLAPGGQVGILTPNVIHYAPLLAHLTPHRFHVWFNHKLGRKGGDIFPTTYKANTLRKLVRTIAGTGLRLRAGKMFEPRPDYLRISLPLFLLGTAYERLVARCGFLATFRANIIAVFEKGGI